MATKPKRNGGLGSGLGALIKPAAAPSEAPAIQISQEQKEKGVREINIAEIEPASNQPRKTFDKKKIDELAESIKEYGLIQPIIVTKQGKTYKIIAGERRWRAARVAGLKKIPAIEREATNREVMELAIIENIQREDLNPIEEAEAYNNLMKEFNLTQDEMAERMKKSRPAIANSLRLLNCEAEIRAYLVSGELSAGHARTILGLSKSEDRIDCAKQVIKNQLSVRQTEMLVKKYNYKKTSKSKAIPFDNDFFKAGDVKAVQESLKKSLGTKVKLEDNQGKGKIVIEYYSADERERLIDMLSKIKG